MKKGEKASKPYRRKYTPEQRFFSKVDMNGPLILKTRCWNWSGALNSSGYGGLWLNGKYYRAHRFSYEFAVGPIPSGALICHECDNPKCVNPKHLWIGDNYTNRKDSRNKDRLSTAKLRVAQVKEIKELAKTGWSDKALATAYKVHPMTIKHIRRGRTWAEIK